MIVNPRVALLVMESTFTHRMLKGVREYILKRETPWIVHTTNPEPAAAKRLNDWKPDGMIVYANDHIMADLERWPCPKINISNRIRNSSFPTVRFDNEAIGEMAGRHLLGLGFRNFAFVGIQNFYFSEQRLAGFRKMLQQTGLNCFNPDEDFRACLPEEWASWKAREHYIRSWLDSLPKPLAVFCVNDVMAKELADTCLHAGIGVPEHVAILGVDNSVQCELAIPSLSSIETNATQQGFEAAALLDRLMNGEKATQNLILIPPQGVVSRGSTELNALHDADLVDAVRYIRESFAQPINVRDILKKVAISRRTLERKFQDVLGRSPQQEIRRIRMDRARELLTQTDLSVRVIAQRTGFANPQRFANVFKQETDRTPLKYRKEFTPGRFAPNSAAKSA